MQKSAYREHLREGLKFDHLFAISKTNVFNTYLLLLTFW